MQKSTSLTASVPEEETHTYEQLNAQYLSNNYTYKCNRIIKELCNKEEPYKYPEYLIIKVCKQYHLNQFELVFFSQILTTQPCHELESEIFLRASKSIGGIANSSDKPFFLYLMVIGYAVKSYLNDNATIYEAKSKQIVPEFDSVFQYWAKRYAQAALKTNPKKLNAFYVDVIKSDDHEDQNFKNYNEIVEDLKRLAPELSDDEENGGFELGSKLEQI